MLLLFWDTFKCPRAFAMASACLSNRRCLRQLPPIPLERNPVPAGTSEPPVWGAAEWSHPDLFRFPRFVPICVSCFARGRCRRGRSEIPHFCSKLLQKRPCPLGEAEKSEEKGEKCIEKGEKCVEKGEKCVEKGENHSDPISTPTPLGTSPNLCLLFSGMLWGPKWLHTHTFFKFGNYSRPDNYYITWIYCSGINYWITLHLFCVPQLINNYITHWCSHPRVVHRCI